MGKDLKKEEFKIKMKKKNEKIQEKCGRIMRFTLLDTKEKYYV